MLSIMEDAPLGKVDKHVIEEVTGQLAASYGHFTVADIIERVERIGFGFGEDGELIAFGKKQMVRGFISRITNRRRKRLYVSVGQISMFGDASEQAYMSASDLTANSEGRRFSLRRMMNHMIGSVKKAPPEQMPDGLANELIEAIRGAFAKYIA